MLDVALKTLGPTVESTPSRTPMKKHRAKMCRVRFQVLNPRTKLWECRRMHQLTKDILLSIQQLVLRMMQSPRGLLRLVPSILRLLRDPGFSRHVRTAA